MKTILSLSLLSILLCPRAFRDVSPGQMKPTLPNPRLLIAKCVEDGFNAQITEDPVRERIARFADVELDAAFPPGDASATFWFVRANKELFRFTAKDLVSSSVWIAVDHSRALDRTHDEAHVALTYSDGGAIGAFHVRVFLIDGGSVTDASGSINQAVADFKSRHYCKARGNNVTALKWIAGSLLLLTEVYPTGDCGADLGHLEGYRISVPGGEILEHLTLSELQRYPGVCLQNDDES